MINEGVFIICSIHASILGGSDLCEILLDTLEQQAHHSTMTTDYRDASPLLTVRHSQGIPMENNNTFRTYAAVVINTYSEAARIYASASIERRVMYETPFSELAYQNARTVAHFARLAFGI